MPGSDDQTNVGLAAEKLADSRAPEASPGSDKLTSTNQRGHAAECILVELHRVLPSGVRYQDTGFVLPWATHHFRSYVAMLVHACGCAFPETPCRTTIPNNEQRTAQISQLEKPPGCGFGISQPPSGSAVHGRLATVDAVVLGCLSNSEQ